MVLLMGIIQNGLDYRGSRVFLCPPLDVLWENTTTSKCITMIKLMIKETFLQRPLCTRSDTTWLETVFFNRFTHFKYIYSIRPTSRAIYTCVWGGGGTHEQSSRVQTFPWQDSLASLIGIYNTYVYMNKHNTQHLTPVLIIM